MRAKTIVIALFLIGNGLNSQTIQYFEIGMRNPAPGWDWRDTAFVVAASDSVLLAEIEAELDKPIAQRRHVSGLLEAGHGGFNHNSDFWFNWHFGPDDWQFAEVSAEVCDGLPFADVNSDTTYWFQTVGYFCPWSSYVKREVTVAAPEPGGQAVRFLPAVPNPANNEILLSWELKRKASLTLSITDALGRMTVTIPLGEQQAGIWTKPVGTAALSDGVYIAVLQAGKHRVAQQFMVQH
ncbi:MAG: T9SS C-terminal target domain-containing protein [Haliscomenobacteraceae bacterium CHB4]|nr:hypothetical protein [Saprospiraceae bacterium]MCE7924826.1 T9SS C-terminal target domain-containing protein [Haliscomenobacteraceae bacterium CHB4]